MGNQKVWFITGASKGMGLEIAKAVLASGDRVVATSRSLEEQVKNLGKANEDLLLLKADITNEAEVRSAVEKSIAAFGKIDVVVNNAGYYLVGSVEEITDEEFRKTVDVNLFGTVNVIRQVMPFLRRQQSGHIINISSNMGYVGYASTGSYNASKFAVIGLSEALAEEVKPFGVKVTVVAPGMFRTSFMSDSTLMAATHKIEAYQTDKHLNLLRSFNGHQPGDPKKLAQVLLGISRMEEPPLHLPLGPDSYESILAHREKEAVEMKQWQQLSHSTNFD